MEVSVLEAHDSADLTKQVIIGEEIVQPVTVTCTCCRQLFPLSENWSKLLVEEADVPETHELGQISIIKCISCHKYLGMFGNGSKYRSFEDILRNSATTERKMDGWKNVEGVQERQALFVLCLSTQEYDCYGEMEFCFTFPPPKDLCSLLWVDQMPVGFLSIKPKGTLDPCSMECYCMTTLDTIFIQPSHRGKGWGTQALENLLSEFPHENIGFSFPTSDSMLKLIWKALQKTPSLRTRLWEVTGCGSEGNLRNLWWFLQRQQKPPAS